MRGVLQKDLQTVQAEHKQLLIRQRQLQTKDKELLTENKKLRGKRGDLDGQNSALQSNADLHAGELKFQIMDYEVHFTYDGLQRQLWQLQSESWSTNNDHSRLTTLCQDQELTVFRLGQDLHYAALDAKVAQQAHLQRTLRLEEERDFARSRLHDTVKIVTDVQGTLRSWLEHPFPPSLQVQDILLLIQQEIQTLLDTKDKRISRLTNSHRSVSAGLELSNKKDARSA